MSRRAHRLITRAASGRTRSGDGRGIITYRHHTRSSGADALTNPPRTTALVINGNPIQGATSISVRGTVLVGRFIAGDQLLVGDAILTVASPANAAANVANLTLTAGLPTALADGAAITPKWVNEVSVSAEISGLGKRVPDGRLVQQRDLFLVLPAGVLPWEPSNGDRITLPGGDVREVIAVAPSFADGIAFSYRLQVR